MTRQLSAFFIIAFIASSSFAQEASAPSGLDDVGNSGLLSGNITPFVPEDTITFAGRVNYISSALVMNGASRQINIIDDEGLETIFVVARDATIIGKDGTATVLNWISRNDKVTLEYIVDTHGVKIVKSLKVLAGW